MAHQNRYIFLLRYILPFVDLLTINVVYFVTNHLVAIFRDNLFEDVNHSNLIIYNLLWLVSTAFFRLYNVSGHRKIEGVYRATYKSAAMHLILYMLYLNIFKDNKPSVEFVLTFFAVLILGFIINRLIGTSFHYIAVEKFRTVKMVAVIGSNSTSLGIIDHLKNDKSVSFYGGLGDEYIYFGKEPTLSAEGIKKLSEAVLAGVKDVYVTVSPDKMVEIRPLLEEADRQGVRIKFIPDLGLSPSSNYGLSYLANEFPVITVRHEPLEDMGNRFKKRAFDLLFSSLVILLILSWLYPLIALLIKLESRGPVLFKQKRSGRKDVPFLCYKFRSMTVNEHSDNLQATKSDVRITKIGRFLRKTSLDEMPQFFNVFIGKMSIVGPRPHMLSHTTKYKSLIDKFMVRHFVKPGITGWAQVHGFRGETKNVSDMKNRVKHDIYYLENWTAMLDVRIVFMTIINMLNGEDNAY